MNGRPILQVMQRGVGFTCAHCEKFWWGVDNSTDGCKAKHERKECTGPLGGGAFPEYQGPLTGHITRFCFVCGQTPAGAAVVKGGRVGVCEKHMEWLGTYTRPNEYPPFVTHRYIDTIGAK